MGTSTFELEPITLEDSELDYVTGGGSVFNNTNNSNSLNFAGDDNSLNNNSNNANAFRVG